MSKLLVVNLGAPHFNMQTADNKACSVDSFGLTTIRPRRQWASWRHGSSGRGKVNDMRGRRNSSLRSCSSPVSFLFEICFSKITSVDRNLGFNKSLSVVLCDIKDPIFRVFNGELFLFS